MWETINNLIKSGFPLLGIIFYTMILLIIWRNQSDSKARKWRWTAVIMSPPLLGILLIISLQFYPPVSVAGTNVAYFAVVILLVAGIPVWLIGSR
ncbi:MAG: hypothetical protein AAF927_26720 [Bacteroidota bacterium]